MRLLQLNAWTIRLATRIEDMVAKEVPDIIALQETFESDADLGFFPTLTELSDKLRFHHRYHSPVYGVQFMASKPEFGNAIISNLAFGEKQTRFTNLEYKASMSLEDDDYNVRNFQHVTVNDQSGKLVHVINHHGYHVPGHKNGNDFTVKACEQIADYARELDGPVIITGDFNLLPDSESIEIINKDFRNLTKEYGLQTTRTDLTHKTEPCDFIFVNDKIEVNDFYVSEVVASDHQGLVLDFEVK
jgi:endonuclease/exonuclease/phosphatase family metal-dependent hydrolase